MNLLLDSHAALWIVYSPEKLSVKATAALSNKANSLTVSYATLWELAAKTTRGKLPLLGSSIRYLMEELDAMEVSLLRIRRTHILAMEQMPYHHGDPFDRMILAQAAAEDLTLVSGDRELRKYDVKLLW